MSNVTARVRSAQWSLVLGPSPGTGHSSQVLRTGVSPPPSLDQDRGTPFPSSWPGPGQGIRTRHGRYASCVFTQEDFLVTNITSKIPQDVTSETSFLLLNLGMLNETSSLCNAYTLQSITRQPPVNITRQYRSCFQSLFHLPYLIRGTGDPN